MTEQQAAYEAEEQGVAPTGKHVWFEPALSLNLLRESPWNPRKRFTDDGMRELEESVRAKGVITPLLARPAPARSGDFYEIAAGHRRFRAAVATGRPTVPVLIRDMRDEEFLELLVMENDQREDVHALEEAGGYQALLGLPGYDVAKIAARVGRSPKYVYDRLKLLQLVPAAQKLFLEDRFTAGHAILLARLKPEDQARAIEVDDGHGAHIGGVFEPAGGLPFDEDFEAAAKKNPYLRVKAASVRELEEWIRDNVRAEPAHIDAFLFPETAEVLQDVDPDKVILVTHDYRAPDAIRKAGDKKVFGEGNWRRADGKEKSKACEHARVALIACGARQQEALLVCIAKEKCETHWAAWKKERTERQRSAAREGGSGVDRSKSAASEAAARAQEQLAAKREAALGKRWQKAQPDLVAALAGAIKKAPAAALARLLLKEVSVIDADVKIFGGLPKTTDDLIRFLAFAAELRNTRDFSSWFWSRQQGIAALKRYGLDAQAIVDKAVPPEKPAVQTSAKAAGKPKRGTCRKCGCQEDTPCAGGCGWSDATQTTCTACFPPKLSSSAKKPAGKKKAHRS